MCAQVGHRAAEVEETQYGHGTGAIGAGGAAGGEAGGAAGGEAGCTNPNPNPNPKP